MAETDALISRSRDSFIKSSDTFEGEIKNRLNWSREQWFSSGEAGSRLNKLCNSLRYWRDKLKAACEDVSMVFTLFNDSNDIKIDLVTIIMEIEKIDPKIKVQAFTQFRNPRYLGIYFSSKEERDYVYDRFKMINNNYVVSLTWALANSDGVRNLNVYWLPWTMKTKEIEENLKKYVKCIESQKLTLTMMSGRIMNTGKVAFKVQLKEGVTAESVPHVMKIANLEALITLSGRLPKCLNCGELGHISKKCELRFCRECNTLCNKNHTCDINKKQKSYATVTKQIDKNELFIDADDWNAVQIMKEDAESIQDFDKQKALLSATIVNIQEDIRELNGNNDLKVEVKNGKQGGALRDIGSVEQKILEGGFQNNMFDTDDDFDLDQDSLLSDASVDQATTKVKSVLSANKKTKTKSDIVKDIIKMPNRKRSAKVNKDKKSKKEPSVESNIEGKDKAEEVIRSYGKPNYNNARRKSQDLKFKKLDQAQEFVFTD